MQELFFIKKVAVLGAGVMGAQIAAHCVNAGIETLLFDLAAKEGPANALVDKAIAQLGKLKPSPLASQQTIQYLHARNYSEDLPDLTSCDLVIEAIAERLDWKEELYKRISPFLTDNTILVSNTSGLSINMLADVLPEERKKQFCGVHFFNPPRYMHLAELIPAKTTCKTLLNNLETWLTSYLGKGVIRAKDTPNFIANRIGVFSLLITLHHTQAMDMSLDEVDALTGPLLGRPKSATYRTMDVVGLDTMQHVVHTMEQQLKEDPWHHLFHLPEWLTGLIQKGYLGTKIRQGIYRKQGNVIEVYDIKSGDYRTTQTELSDDLKAIFAIQDPRCTDATTLYIEEQTSAVFSGLFSDFFIIAFIIWSRLLIQHEMLIWLCVGALGGKKGHLKPGSLLVLNTLPTIFCRRLRTIKLNLMRSYLLGYIKLNAFIMKMLLFHHSKAVLSKEANCQYINDNFLRTK